MLYKHNKIRQFSASSDTQRVMTLFPLIVFFLRGGVFFYFVFLFWQRNVFVLLSAGLGFSDSVEPSPRCANSAVSILSNSASAGVAALISTRLNTCFLRVPKRYFLVSSKYRVMVFSGSRKRLALHQKRLERD